MDYIERDKVKKLLSNIKFPFEYSEDFYTLFQEILSYFILKILKLLLIKLIILKLYH